MRPFVKSEQRDHVIFLGGCDLHRRCRQAPGVPDSLRICTYVQTTTCVVHKNPRLSPGAGGSSPRVRPAPASGHEGGDLSALGCVQDLACWDAPGRRIRSRGSLPWSRAPAHAHARAASTGPALESRAGANGFCGHRHTPL